MSRTHAALVCILAVAVGAIGCTLLPGPRYRGPVEFSEGIAPRSSDPFANWPVEPRAAERILTRGQGKIVDMEGAGGGTTGAQKAKVDLPGEERDFFVKWKPMPRDLDGINNSPRREIAAYAIQSLYLDPEDYVVPTMAASCLPVSQVGGQPSRPGSRCALGGVALWLDNVTVPDALIDGERFRRDPLYARHLANFNLLTYLIKHKDGRKGNFLASKDDADRVVFAVDNGVAFGGIFYNWFVYNWDKIRVPALRKESVDRLRALERSDLDALGVVAQLKLDEDGIFRNVDPGENLGRRRGVRVKDRVIQLGLTKSEIKDIWERIEDLIEEVDEGDVQVF